MFTTQDTFIIDSYKNEMESLVTDEISVISKKLKNETRKKKPASHSHTEQRIGFTNKDISLYKQATWNFLSQVKLQGNKN